MREFGNNCLLIKGDFKMKENYGGFLIVVPPSKAFDSNLLDFVVADESVTNPVCNSSSAKARAWE